MTDKWAQRETSSLNQSERDTLLLSTLQFTGDRTPLLLFFLNPNPAGRGNEQFKDMWSASIIEVIMLNLIFAAMATRNLRCKEIMLHVNQYSTAHTAAAREFDGIFAQWSVASCNCS